MEALRSKAVLEAVTDFDPAKLAGFSPAAVLTIRSLAVFRASEFQTLIYVGTGGGKLILFTLNPSSSPTTLSSSDHSFICSQTTPLEFLRTTTISNGVVESIHVLAEIGIVLVLSSGFLFMVDILLLLPSRKLGFAKEVNAISKRVMRSDSSISDPFGDGVVRAEFSRPGQTLLQKLGGGVRANGGAASKVSDLHRGGKSCFLAAAAGKRLVLIKLVLLSDTELDADYSGISIFWKEFQGVEGVKSISWIDDSIIVGTREGYILFSDVSGKGSVIFSLPESSSPLVSSLVRSSNVLLLVDNVGVICNALGHPVGGSLIFQYVPESVADMHPYVIVAKDGRFDLYKKKTSFCIQSISLAKGSVGPCIVATDDHGSAEIVVFCTTYKVFCYRKVSPEEQIKDMLRKKHYKETICLLEEFESEGDITRQMLSFVHAQLGFLLLFDLHFEDAIDHFLLSESMDPSEVFPFLMRDPNRWSHLVPRKRYWGLHPPPVPLEQVVDDRLMAMQRAMFLRKAGVDTAADEDYFMNPPSRADLLQSAIENFIRYLCICREKVLPPFVKEGVDSLLMYLYRALNRVHDMEKLASSQNNCVVEELEPLLDGSGHLRTLAFLYANKGMLSKALTIWRILARNYSSELWKDHASSVDSSSGLSLELRSGQRVAASEASKLLQESSDEMLVLEHVGWVADIDRECAIIVLTSEKRMNQLSPENVIAAIDPKKVEIQQRYLQWLIEEQESYDMQFHTLYALSLARSAIESVEMDSRPENHGLGNFSDVYASDVENKSVPIRERLQLFLEASDLYDPETVLKVVEGSELWLEKAILYRKMGLENLVLEILALKLEDYEAAEKYCAEIGRSDTYMQLLDMYLDPQDGKEPILKAAVHLLHNHGESLDPLQVLEKLSPAMPLQLASDTILRMLRARVHHHHQGQIVHNLSRAISLDSSLARLEERSRNVQINDESVCNSCHTRLGTKLFAMYPDDSIVCYKCYRRLGESTSARGRDFKQNPIFKAGWLVSR
ncbi:hypothetical protein AXF42_Ash009601 [Apostasia shenzhenica]|uniref:CNH domain-containing protein n=1 Tax=Apostasia shenzhenica TaxID=1088818 RepID=A0A2I0B9C4_9ASPA|nr:hypothetical protein AXF42_Ash009601 [Apostasia shenzhenica]